MAFKPGHKLSKGRPKGALNRSSLAAKEILADAGFCPITALIDTHEIAMTRFKEEIEKQDAGTLSPMESAAPKYLKLAVDTASDLASFAHSKLKSIEQIKSSPLDGMTNTEKLEAMKQAVRMLEAEAKREPGAT